MGLPVVGLVSASPVHYFAQTDISGGLEAWGRLPSADHGAFLGSLLKTSPSAIASVADKPIVHEPRRHAGIIITSLSRFLQPPKYGRKPRPRSPRPLL